MVRACCWYRKPQECTGNKESEDVYDNPDDLTQWAHVDVMMGVVMYIKYYMYRSPHEQMKMTECAAYSTHQPQHTTDVYEPVTTTNWIVHVAYNTTACMFA